MTNTSAVLSWSPPDNGGGRPLYEIVYTIHIHGMLNTVFKLAEYHSTALDGSSTLKKVVNSTETIVTGLTPGVLYTFSVSAENDVSSQDNNINARTVNISIATGQLLKFVMVADSLRKIFAVQYLLVLETFKNTVLLWFGRNRQKLMVLLKATF